MGVARGGSAAHRSRVDRGSAPHPPRPLGGVNEEKCTESRRRSRCRDDPRPHRDARRPGGPRRGRPARSGPEPARPVDQHRRAPCLRPGAPVRQTTAVARTWPPCWPATGPPTRRRFTSEPSDSAPGTMALLTGGDPKLTGVYYDDSYDRTMYTPAAQTSTGDPELHGPPGAETHVRRERRRRRTHLQQPERHPAHHGRAPRSRRSFHMPWSTASASRCRPTISCGPTRSSAWPTPPGSGRRGPTSTRSTTLEVAGNGTPERGERSVQHRDQRGPDPAFARRHPGQHGHLPVAEPHRHRGRTSSPTRSAIPRPTTRSRSTPSSTRSTAGTPRNTMRRRCRPSSA